MLVKHSEHVDPTLLVHEVDGEREATWKNPPHAAILQTVGLWKFCRPLDRCVQLEYEFDPQAFALCFVPRGCFLRVNLRLS